MKQVLPTTIETVSGRQIDLMNPSVGDINIDDVAWGLSRQVRFAGHTITDIPYSVAQHSVHVANIVQAAVTPGTDLHNRYKQFTRACEAELALTSALSSENAPWLACSLEGNAGLFATFGGLLHDASEAYLIDLPSPVKRLPGISEAYLQVEKTMMDKIHEAFNLPYHDKWPRTKEAAEHIIHWADLYARALEAYHFMPSRGANWGMEKPSIAELHGFRQPIPSLQAYHEFIQKFNELHEPVLIAAGIIIQD